MSKKYVLGLAATGIAVIGTLCSNVQSASAFVLHNGWNYSIDAKNDSTPFNADGNGAFEIYGSAYKVADGKVTFAINSNVDLANGVNWSNAVDGKIHFTDILLNFTGQSLDAANGQLFGLHFAANNDSGVSPLGVYSNVTAKQVASINGGWSSLGDYNNDVLGQGVTPKIGDLAYNDPYFNSSKQILNSIQSGTKIGDISVLSDLSGLGLDFANFGKTGSQTIAFSFDAGLLPTSQSGIFHFGVECDNDLVGGEYTEVPTPAAVLPAIFGLFGAAFRKKENNNDI